MVYRNLDKQALKENGYTVLSKITLLNDNSVFTEDDFIVDWNYEDYRYVPNKGFIGEFIERILDGNLQNIPDNKIFENQEINLQIGIVNGIDNVTTWYDYGNFLITKVEKTDTTGRYKFESADYTKKFNKEYEDTINYPCLAMELANDVCNQAEVDLATVNNCYIYIADENGLAAGNYNFKVENTYYNFTLAENLEKNDVLYFTKAYLTLTLKKVRFTQQDGYVVTRSNITYTTSTSSGSGTALIMRSVPFIDFTNNDFVIENNQYDEKDTLRKVMQDIGKLAYSWVRIGEDNKVYIDYEQDASVDDYDKLSTNEYYVSKKADLYFGPVNKVLLGMSNIEGENLYKTSSSYTEETECAIKIYDNNLTYTEELRAIALNGCERLFGIEYMPLEIETIGHPWLNGNEMIELTNVDGEVLHTYPFNRRIKYAGYIEGVIGSEAETKQNNEYEYESEIVKQINKTSITVDKNNQTITSLVSNVNEAQNNITELYQTTNEISATVEHLDTEYENTVIVRREAEGNPIEIDNAGNYPLEDFKIYGGTSQDGEPTPNNPQEVNTVTSKTTTENYNGTDFDVDYSYDKDLIKVEKSDTELLGNTTQETTMGYNIYEGSNNLYNNITNTNQFTKTDLGNNELQLTKNTTGTTSPRFFVTLTENETYTISCKVKGDAPTCRIGYWEDGTGMVEMSTITPNTNNYQTMSFTYTSTGANPRIFIRNDTTTFPTNKYIIIKDFMIEKGSTLHDYEPYTFGPTPNPNVPQPIETVTGRQKIDVVGKNLFDYTTTSFALPEYVNIETVNNTITITTTQTSTSNDLFFRTKIPDEYLTNGETYTISSENVSGVYQNLRLQLRNKDGSTANKSINYSITYDDNYSLYIVDNPFSTTSTTSIPAGTTCIIKNVQVEKGSTATTYEPYKGNSYEINLGKNLIDVSTTEVGKAWNNSSNTARAVVYAKVEPNTTYTVSFQSKNGADALYWFEKNNKTDSTVTVATTGIDFTLTKTTSSNTHWIGVQINKSNVTLSDVEGTSLQLEKGSQSTSYAPYKTPIELCKIGTYQDKIFKGKGVNIVRDKNVNSGTAQYTTVLCADCDLKPSTTYTISFYGTADNIVYPNENLFTTYSSFTIPNGLKVLSLTTKDNLSKESVSQYDSTLQMWRIFKNTQAQSKANVFENLQIQEGNVATDYEPYNAKDKWYLYKAIGKHKILASDIFGFYNALTNSREARVRQTTLNCLVGYNNMLYSNKFRKVSNTWNVDNIGIMAGASNPITQISFRIPVNSDASWFTNNETILYFPLATPTTTEITNEELINQLEELNDCEFYSPTSYYRTTSEDLAITSDFNISHLPYKLITINDENNNQLSYRPLFRNLELCKIGDYQDYLYLKNGKWYKHSEIGKVVLNGSENWTTQRNTSPYIYRTTITDYKYTDENISLSDHFKTIKNGTYGTMTDNQLRFRYHSDNGKYLYICTTIQTTDTNFKTWLSTHNTIVYYVLADSTETEINDEEVITELNSLMQTAIYEGYNRIYLNDELCEKLYIKYLTDSMFNDTYATKAQLAITNENISAVVSRSDTLENNIAQLQIDVDEITTNVESVTTLTTDLENSINYLSVDMSANSIIIPTNEENLPYLSTTYTIPFTATFKGVSVNPTVSTSSATITGITLTFGTGVINVGVSSTTPIENLSNSFVINFSYVSDGETYLVSRTLNVALSVKGEDGKDGTSVTILGSYNTLQELQAAHPIGSAGDSYMVGDDLYVWNVSSLAWVDVGQIKGDDGVNAYLYIRYSENPNGNPMVTVPTTSTKYIGVCSTTSSTAPTSYSSYTWSKYSGNDGQTTYLHVKYSEDGATFVPASADADEGDTPSAWVGILTDTNQTASTTFTDYAWYKFTEDIDDQIRTMQSDISKNTTNILNNYSAIIEQLNNYAKSDVVATLTKRVETIENDDAFVINAITDLQVNGVSQVRTEKGFTFNNDGMTIDANNSVTKSVTDTNGIKVLDKSGSSESELLFAGYDETSQTSIVRTENLAVRTYFNIGTKSRFEDYENGTGVFI